MDQLKTIFRHLQKYHFWLLCVVSMIAGVVGWMMATRSLSAAYTTNKAKVLSKFQALDGIGTTDNYPNSTWKSDIDKLTKKEGDEVRKAWELVYSQQQPALGWPDYLKESFLNEVKNVRPGGELRQESLERYGNLINREFSALLTIIGADAHNESKSIAAAAADKDLKKSAPAAPDEKIVWDSSNQQDVEKLLTFSKTPTSEVVWLTQEDLWVYQVLLTIIKQVNAGHDIPPVKRISSMLIGKKGADAFEHSMKATDHIYHPQAPATLPDAGAAAAAVPGGGDSPVKTAADDGRYLDAQGKRLGGGLAIKDPFKRMPIVLNLTMDQRQIPKLLVECANSPLPVEVRQLRINPGKGGGSGTRTTVGGQGDSAGPRASAGKSGPDAEHASYDVPIELYGIIYIYNPPDPSKLGGGQPAAAGVPTPGG